jgi:hypothetical protein
VSPGGDSRRLISTTRRRGPPGRRKPDRHFHRLASSPLEVNLSGGNGPASGPLPGLQAG